MTSKKILDDEFNKATVEIVKQLGGWAETPR